MAKAEYEAGRILYGDKDYGNAILKFMKAHELSKRPAPALEHRRLPEEPAALREDAHHHPTLPDRGGGPPHRAGEANAVEIVKTVESFVSRLKLTASEAGAEVFVDDEKVGETPLEGPMIVDVGKRRSTS